MFQYISGKLIRGTLDNFVFLWIGISLPALHSTSLLLLMLCMCVYFSFYSCKSRIQLERKVYMLSVFVCDTNVKSTNR